MATIEVDPLPILKLPMLHRVGVGFGVAAAVLLGYWYIWFADWQEAYDRVAAEVVKQEEKILENEHKLERVPELKRELAKLRLQDLEARSQLPDKQEIPDILADVSKEGHLNQLKFLLFATANEVKKDVYAEVPLDVKISGSYHAMAMFIEKLAKFPRIVTVGNLSMVPDRTSKDQTGEVAISVQANISTYRFLDPKEVTKKPAKAAPKK